LSTKQSETAIMHLEATNSATEDYHRWYYDTLVWTETTFMGVPCQKSVSDMWNYHEILFELKPSIVVEFGTNAGGSALYFAEMLNLVSSPSRVLSVDIDHSQAFEAVRNHPRIELFQSDSKSPRVADRVRELRAQLPGKVFFIVDSDHSLDHVLGELLLLREITAAGDYVVVEDGNLNGHPVMPGWGPGPLEALAKYFQQFPNDYTRDLRREHKFGFTFAPGGFLIRN
jgi:cephalosporin hydroxylase